MRATYILSIISFILLSSCNTIEVVKEVTKATNSIKNTIVKTTNKSEPIPEVEIPDVEEELVDIEIEKKQLIKEKKKERAVVIKQKKVVVINFLGKTISKLKEDLGEPVLIRLDGNTKTLRFDAESCRLFLYFNINNDAQKAKYYEIRDIKGNLIEKKENIERCYQQLKLV